MLALHSEYRGSMLLVTHDLTEGTAWARASLSSRQGVSSSTTPQKVFAHPVDRTVARLTGVRNLMDGKVNRMEPPMSGCISRPGCPA